MKAILEIELPIPDDDDDFMLPGKDDEIYLEYNASGVYARVLSRKMIP